MTADCEPQLILTDAPGADAQAAVEHGLTAFNREHAGFVDSRKLAVLLTHPGTGEVSGGLLGRTSLGLLFIDLVSLPAASRGRGIGARMLAMAEAGAVARGCTASVLYTITFQAPGFYARHGYRELGRIECDPPGQTRICMTKQLRTPHPPSPSSPPSPP